MFAFHEIDAENRKEGLLIGLGDSLNGCYRVIVDVQYLGSQEDSYDALKRALARMVRYLRNPLTEYC